jgi:hypothetical protein
MLDWSQCKALESVPGRVGGAWAFKNTHLPVSVVFQNLEAGAMLEPISRVRYSRRVDQRSFGFAVRSVEAPTLADHRITSIDGA